MKKTVHIINAMEIGGVEVGVLSLLRSNLSENYNVVLVKGCDSLIYDELTPSEKDRIFVSNGYLAALKTLIKLKPDIVVSSLWRAHFVTLLYQCLNFKFKHIHFMHSARFGHIIDMLVTKVSLFFSDSIFCDSKLTKEWLLNNSSIKNADVVNMNVSFTNETKLTSFKPYSFVFVGRFAKQKNLLSAFEFIEELKHLGLDVYYDLYGRDDGELSHLKNIVNKKKLSDCIKFYDSINPDKIESKMREYNYYLQSSLVEGMSISVFQSIKNGLLPIVTPVGEIPNYSKHLYNAFFLDDKDIKKSAIEFARTIKQNEFDEKNIGVLINSNEYISFDVCFFDKIKKIF